MPQNALDFSDPSLGDGQDLMASKRRTGNALDPADVIMGYLNARRDWSAKADILSATGLTDSQWSIAIAGLVASGFVERQGDRRGTRYRSRSESPESRGAKP